MKAFQSCVPIRRLRSIVVATFVGAVLLFSLPTVSAAKPLPPVENGDPTDTDYGPSPKKTATFSTLIGSPSAASRNVVSRKGTLWGWLNYVIAATWRRSPLR
jgi:hypothetical protein